MTNPSLTERTNLPPTGNSKTARVNRKVAWVCLLVSAILIADSFILKPTPVKESFNNSDTEYSRVRGTSTTTHFIKSKSGHSYRVPFSVYLWLSSTRDTFIVYKSALLKRQLKIQYQYVLQPTVKNIGVLNNGFARLAFVIIAIIIALLNVFPSPVIKGEKFNQQMLFLGAFLLLAIVVIYFWQS